jgi:vacuolar-type H+-ATPase subunit E/Vma4
MGELMRNVKELEETKKALTAILEADKEKANELLRKARELADKIVENAKREEEKITKEVVRLRQEKEKLEAEKMLLEAAIKQELKNLKQGETAKTLKTDTLLPP